MYVDSPRDRGLIRRALDAMSEMARDELASEDVESMYRENVAFILAALRGLTNDLHRELPIVTENFRYDEIVRLDQLLSELSATDTPRIDLTGKVMLTEAEVTEVLAESDELTQKLNAITTRLAYLQGALHVSGETKLREMRHIRTWYYDGETTHGIKGLATVTDVRTQNIVGVGPDHVYVGTADELVTYLRAIGYTEIETDIEILSIAWRKAVDS